MKQSRVHQQERPSLALIEEATALLCNAPLTIHALYVIGSLPFVTALLFFWTDMSRGAFASQRVTTTSLGLALLFIWMKFWQAHHAAGLRAYLETVPTQPLTVRRSICIAARQGLLHGIGLFLLPLSLILVVPFAWVYTFLQNCSVYGSWESLGLCDTVRKAWRQATYWPLQNHYVIWMVSPLLMMLTCVALLVIVPFLSVAVPDVGFLLLLPLLLLLLVVMSPISILVAINLFILILLVPVLLRMLLGIETVFSRGLTGMFNSTSLATTAALTYLTLDPLMKAVYVLRCFYAESITSGADLRSSLTRIASRTAATVLLLGVLGSGAISVQAAPSQTTLPKLTEPDQLDQVIDLEIQRAEYAWRLPRDEGFRPGEDSKLVHWMNQISARLDSWITILFNHGDWFQRWLERLFPDPQVHQKKENWATTLQVLLYGAILLLVITLVVSVVRLLGTRKKSTEEIDTAVVLPTPDLEDEQLAADSLPEDEWMALAQRLMTQGDYRLAIRACFLAALAHLALRELVRIRSHKSNRDYLRELERRTHAHPEVPGAFQACMHEFERVWYGDREATPSRYDDIALTFLRMKESC